MQAFHDMYCKFFLQNEFSYNLFIAVEHCCGVTGQLVIGQVCTFDQLDASTTSLYIPSRNKNNNKICSMVCKV